MIIVPIGIILLTFTACENAAGGDSGSTGPVFESVAEVAAYLETAAGGYNPSNAIPIAVNIYLGTMTDENSGWRQLLDVLESAGKLVALDLSNSGCNGNVFDPDSSIGTGKEFIVSLIFPISVTSIAGGYEDDHFIYPTLGFFSNLSGCSGVNVTNIGEYAFFCCDALKSLSFPVAKNIGHYAFYWCDALKSVSFPAVQSIGDFVFWHCDALQSVSFPVAKNIGENAFEDCTALQNVSFPAVQGIGERSFTGCVTLKSASFPVAQKIRERAFYHCDALQSVSIPAVTSIGDWAFGYTGSVALTITMGNPAPYVENNLFGGYTTKPVTVRVPAAALASYDAAWRDTVIGGSDITLTFKTY